MRELDNVWDQLQSTPLTGNPLRARETAAMAATARWCYTAAALRKESRGMHQRSDTPGQRSQYDAHLRLSGVEQIQARFDSIHLGQPQ